MTTKYTISCSNWGGNSASPSRKGETNDCTVRATSVAFMITYEEAHKMLAAAGRKNRKGFNYYRFLHHNSFINDYVAWKEITSFRKTRNVRVARGRYSRYYMPGDIIKRECSVTVKTFLDKFADPSKRYVVRVNRHVIPVVNGRMQDSEYYLNCRVKQVYEITPKVNRPGAINPPMIVKRPVPAAVTSLFQAYLT